jgi:signal peptidase I
MPESCANRATPGKSTAAKAVQEPHSTVVHRALPTWTDFFSRPVEGSPTVRARMSVIRHLLWKVYREAGQLADSAEKILNHQRDELAPKNLEEMESAIARLRQVRATGTKEEIQAEMRRLETSANQWLNAYPNASIRDNVEGFVTMAILLFAFRQFFFQPMVIPTGSAQPTFNGITSEDLRFTGQQVPNVLVRAAEWALFGYHYVEVIATEDGEFAGVEGPAPGSAIQNLLGRKFLVRVGNREYPVSTSMSEGRQDFPRHMSLVNEYGTFPQRRFKAGEPIIRCRIKSGDRLFVDRVTYNFRRPQRGETVVFKSLKHPGMTANTHYIKRLIALGGETVTIGDDRHVTINGRRIESTDSGFEKVYSFDTSLHPASSRYSGHVNGIGFAEGYWFSPHEVEYELMRSADPSAKAGLAQIASEKAAIWRGFTNATMIPSAGPLREQFLRNKAQLDSMSRSTPNFPDAANGLTVPAGQVLCFGDNTMNSSDSRMWPLPYFPEERIVGCSGWVFWPLSTRWGWSQH